jgi:hypothetical protein
MFSNPSWTVLLAAVFIAAMTGRVAVFQDRAKQSPPGEAESPTWQRLVRLSDGRTFVTDGGLAIDAALAKPNVLPTEVVGAGSAKLLEGYLTAPLKDEFGLGELNTGGNPRTYTAPTGVVLNANYVDYLRRTLATATLRFRVGSDLQPVVILMNGSAIGVLMPMKR